MYNNCSRIENVYFKVTVTIKPMVNNKANPLKLEWLNRYLVLSSSFNNM